MFEMMRIDVEARSDIAARLRVTSVPTLLVVEGRRVRARLEIVSSAQKLDAFLAPWLK
jgi:thioredoxin-like negative regulator of GroEL